MTCLGNGWARIAARSVDLQPPEDRTHDASGASEDGERAARGPGEQAAITDRTPHEERSEPCA